MTYAKKAVNLRQEKEKLGKSRTRSCFYRETGGGGEGGGGEGKGAAPPRKIVWEHSRRERSAGN